MKCKSPDSSRCARLLWTLLVCCCGGITWGIDHYDTEYMSGQECALVLKRSSHDPSPLYSNRFAADGPGSTDCIRYDDVNEALKAAKKRMGYEPFNVNLAAEDNNLLGIIAELILETSKNLAQKFQLTFDEIIYGLPTIDTSKTDIWDICPDMHKPTPCTASRFRTFDGQCSSLKNSVIGMARIPFKRFLAPEYSDGISAPKVSPVDGKPLPYVRELSLKVHPDINQLTEVRAFLFMSWGQFIAYDMTASDNPRVPVSGAEIECCPPETPASDALCIPIPISGKDPFYWRYNSTCMSTQRNIAGIRPKCALGLRTPSNFVTARLDANFLYGNSDSENKPLRLGSKGMFRMNPKFRDIGLKDLLPPMTELPDKNCRFRPQGKYCFLSGDPRVSFQPHVLALHHTYHREHNRIAMDLSYLNPHWDDERLFQETRHIIIAVIQHICFNEFLPALLGPDFTHAFNLTLMKEGYWYGYDKNVVLGTDLTVQSAAFRLHTLLDSKFSLFNKHHEFVSSLEVHNVIEQPYDAYQPGYIDLVLGGMVNSPLQNYDRYITSEVTKHLYEPPTQGFGRDLVSLNINRGRDNGLPGYNDYREWCGMPRFKTFEEMDYYLTNWTALQFSKIYRHPDDVDLWSAGISEIPVKGGFVGPTFACILARQFNRNRRGDRYWYENPGFPSSFTPGQLQQIRKMTQAKIICDNADDFPTIQKYSLFLANDDNNPRYNCKDLPYLDLKFWVEDPNTKKFSY